MTDIATRPEFPAVPEPKTVGSPPMTAPDAAEMVEEVLVEEVSIDGMCGVY